MSYVHADTLDKLTAITAELPDDKAKKLLDFIAGWRADVRQSGREPYKETLRFKSSTKTHSGRTINISATGIFIETAYKFEIGDRVELKLTFISAPDLVHVTGSVIRKSESGIGIHFDDKGLGNVNDLNAIIANHVLIAQQR